MHTPRSTHATLIVLLCMLGCVLAWLTLAHRTSSVEAAGPRGAETAVLYVKADATGSNDGTSWTNAFPSLQSALDVATPGTEVWVAAGAYTPTLRVFPPAPRSATFVITNGVALYGGFAGNETRLDQRDWATHAVTLSGDILDNDQGDFSFENPSFDDNCLHVVTNIAADPSAVLDGFTISGGVAKVWSIVSGGLCGGGLYIESGSPTLANCTFERNISALGALYIGEGSPTLTNCSFQGNSSEYGGGIYNSGNPTLMNCTFQGNTAIAELGGGMYNSGNPTLTNCAFRGNAATGYSSGAPLGGGLYNEGGYPILLNCTFAENEAGDGGGMYNGGGSVMLTNCVFQGNTTYGKRRPRYPSSWGAGFCSEGGDSILTNCTFEGNWYRPYGETYGSALGGDGRSLVLRNTIVWGAGLGGPGFYTLTVAYSLVQGGCPYGATCDHVWDADPLFADAAHGDLRLRRGSAAIEAGNNAVVPAGATTDLAGAPRIVGTRVDLGAYEAQPGVTLSKVALPERPLLAGDLLTYVLTVDNISLVTATHVLLADVAPPEVTRLNYRASGISITPTGDVAYTWQVSDLASAAHGLITLTGIISPALVGRVTFTNTASITSTMPSPEMAGEAVSVQTRAHSGRVCRVKADATGANDGSSWDNAFRDLQAALSEAWYGDEIWVAAGVYTPTLRTDPAYSTSVTFMIADGVALYGGFAGDEVRHEEREPAGSTGWARHVTTLSGAIGEDEFGRQAYADHVVTGMDTEGRTTLDGFTITVGKDAYGSVGVYFLGGSPTLANCTFLDTLGAGMANRDGSPTLTHCSFRDGGISNGNGSPTLTDCAFQGGGVSTGDGQPTLTNCTFWKDSVSGTDIALRAGLGVAEVRNSILWGYGANPLSVAGALTVSHSLVQGGCPAGVGCDHVLDSDPLLVAPAQGDLRLRYGSPALDAGHDAYVQGVAAGGEHPTDLAGNARIQGTHVDLGAFEATPGVGILKTVSPTEPLLPGAPLTYTLSFGNSGLITATGVVITDLIPAYVTGIAYQAAGVTVTPTGAVSYTWQVADLAPDQSGVIRITGIISPEVVGAVTFTNTSSITCTLPQAIMPGNSSDVQSHIRYATQGILYVKSDAMGTGDGLSWRNAFTDLQTALAMAWGGDQIWVAAGTYTPTARIVWSVTFQLKESVALYGGFAGDETVREQRDWATHVVTLSGGDDVVTSLYAGSSTVLDGFIITSASGRGMNIVGGNPTVRHCTFRGNSPAWSSGGGMRIEGGNPTLINCTFEGNWAGAGSAGGGIYSQGGSPVLINCTFRENHASFYGGGMYIEGGNPTLTHCTFQGNSVQEGGGGMYNTGGNPTLINCIFQGNTAHSYTGRGGGMYNADGRTTLTNCTFQGNSIQSWVDGIHSERSGTLVLRNSILWSGSISNGYSPFTAVVVDHSLVQGGCPSGAICDQVSGADPLFVDVARGDLRLQPASPAIDAGNDAYVIDVPIDLDGNPRVVGRSVDIGAYEAAPGVIIAKRVLPSAPLVAGDPLTYVLTVDNVSLYTATGVLITGVVLSFVSLLGFDASGITPTPTGHVSYTWQVADLLPAAHGVITLTGVISPELRACLTFTNTARISSAIPASSAGREASASVHTRGILYVKADARGAHDGRTWANAFVDLQSALSLAQAGDDIWVAAGTYTPTLCTDPSDVRTATFQLMDGVALYGGFAGHETRRDQRDWSRYTTILSGDLGAIGDARDNAYHVITNSSTDANATLDGFLITAGNANGSGLHYAGGGLYDLGGSPTVANCTFRGNSASVRGGGVSSGGVTLTNCIFQDNTASEGGGMSADSGSPTLINCTFLGNTGGGMRSFYSSPKLTNCVFQNNPGGGMRNEKSNPTLTNCTFVGNQAGSDGGGMYNLNSQPVLHNSILWDNGANPITVVGYSLVKLDHSLVQGGCPEWADCQQVSGADPLFVDAAHGDLRLRPGSPAIDAGDDSYVSGVPTDLAGNPRIVGAHVDMGAYETVLGVGIHKRVGPSALAAPGGPLTYTLTFANTGPITATGVLITDTIPAFVLPIAYRFSGVPITPTGSVSYTWQAADLAPGAVGVITITGVIRPETALRSTFTNTAYITGTTAPAMVSVPWSGVQVHVGGILYVRADATGANNGSSWADAFRDLQSAFATAWYGEDIWVAAGTYTPTLRTDPTDARSAAFQMKSGLELYGGFAGYETRRDQRDWATHVVTLSGDIGVVGEANDNAYHVVASIGADASVVLDGFTISGASGAGMSNAYGSSPTLANCTFRGNVGSGMSNAYSSPRLSGCTFQGNSGNGMYNESGSSPTLTNCSFQGNSGYGMYNESGSSPTLTNCTFQGNAADGVLNYNSGSTLTNCTFRGNSGDGVSNIYSMSIMRNSIVWGNGRTPVSSSSSTITLDHSLVQGGCPEGATCDQVLDAEPLFVDGLRLQGGSPAINAGEDSYVADVRTDLAGNPRIIGLHVDLGAYEAAFGVTICKRVMPSTPLVAGDPLTYVLTVDNVSLVTAGGVLITDVVPAYVSRFGFDASGITLTPTGHVAYTWQVADLLPGAHGVITLTGVISPEHRACLTFTNTARISSTTPASGGGNEASTSVHTRGILYVKAGSQGAHDGLTWANASGDLQLALNLAQAGDEIWVAAGTYTPTARTDPVNARTATFQLRNGVALYGGFVGDETARAQRDWATHVVTLSGDIGVAGEPGDNALRLVTSTDADASTVLDGFAISGASEAGVDNYHSSPTLTHCTFRGNSGNAMHNSVSSPTLTNCTFHGNSGNGIFNHYDSSPTLTNCTFQDNLGSGMTNGWSNYPTVRNSILWGNGAGSVSGESGNNITLDHSLVQGGCPEGVTCNQVLSADPMFVDAGHGDLRLRPESPAVDAGEDSYVIGVTTDLAGTPRIVGAHVDMGAYESAPDLTISKTLAPTTPLRPGDPLTFTLGFANTGLYTATGVLITDTVSPYVLRITHHASGATITPTGGISYTWRVADLAPGMGGVIIVSGVIDPQIVGRQTFVNTAQIAGTLGEVTTANNVATVEVVVEGPTVTPTPTATPTPRRWGLWLPLLWRGP